MIDRDESYLVWWTCILETRDSRAMERVAARIRKLLGAGDQLGVHPDDAARGTVRVGYRFDGPRASCVLDALERCSKLCSEYWTVDPRRLSTGEFVAWSVEKFRTAGIVQAHLEIEPAWGRESFTDEIDATLVEPRIVAP